MSEKACFPLGFFATLYGVMAQTSGNVIPPSYDNMAAPSSQPTSDTLEEAVIRVAYGKTKKSTFVGSAEKISAKDMAPRVATSFVNKMDGAVAGLTVGATGRPGSNAALLIRGQSSINSGTAPLIILNGMQYGGDLASINSDIIESISVLKDASATALYGSRAAGGVILVATKTGADAPNKFSVDVQATFGTNMRFIPEYQRTDVEQHIQIVWQRLRSNELIPQINAIGNGRASFIPAADLARAGQVASNNLVTALGGYNIYNTNQIVLPNGQINPNARRIYTPDLWSKAMIQTKLRQEHNINLSGNTGKVNYFVGLGYLNDPGIILNTSFERYSFNLNMDAKMKKWLKLGANVSYRHTDQGNATTDGMDPINAFYISRVMPALYPVHVHNPVTGQVLQDPTTGQPIFDLGVGAVDNNGNYYPNASDAPAGARIHRRPVGGNSNAIGQNFLDRRNNQADEFSGRFYLLFQLLEGFTLRSSLGTDLRYAENLTNQNATLGEAASVGGRTTRETFRQTNINISNVLNYTHRLHGFLDDGITVNATLGHELFTISSFGLTGTRTGLGEARLVELSNGATVTGATSVLQQYRLQGVFGRLSFDYKDKYFVEASVRGDQSSVFAHGKQWGAFYAVGAGWDMAKEDFFQPAAQVMNQLKIKASWGLTGNDGSRGGLGFYQYQELFQSDLSDLDLPGAIRSRFATPNITWERLGKGNLGVEMSFLKGRISAGLDAYYNPVSNMLFARPLAPSVGLTFINENIGNMYNNGIEFNITAWAFRAKQARGFSWKLSLNGYWQHNKITVLHEQNKEAGLVTGLHKFTEGGSIFDYYLRRYAGVDAAGRPQWHMTTGDRDERGNLKTQTDANGKTLYDKDGNPMLVNARDTLTTNYSQATQYLFKSYLPQLRGAFHTTLSYKGFELYIMFKYQIGGKYLDTDYADLMSSSGQPSRNTHEDVYTQHAQIVTDAAGNGHIVTNGNPIIGTMAQNANLPSDRFLFDASYLSLKNITLTYALPPSVIKAMRMSAFSLFFSVENIFIVSHLKSGASPENLGGSMGYTYPELRALNGGIKLRF